MALNEEEAELGEAAVLTPLTERRSLLVQRGIHLEHEPAHIWASPRHLVC